MNLAPILKAKVRENGDEIEIRNLGP